MTRPATTRSVPAAMRPEVAEIHLAVPPGQLVQYDHSRLVSALRPYGVTDPSTVLVETDGAGGAILTVYARPPLETLPAARGEDLVMDAHGYITVGRWHDGEPARMRLYIPGSGAQRAAMFGTTGAGKSRALQLLLAAEKRSGIASWVADLKGGQSVPEARGNVSVRVTTQEGAIVMLMAGLWEAEDRMERYAAAGRSAFVIGRPDRLLSLRIDEANRLLAPSASYRAVGAHLITEAGRAGRSVGEGVGIAAQAAHIDELGGSDTLRAMLREGETVLLRWSSGMMASLVGDGLLPDDAVLVPIPREAGPRRLTSRFDRPAGGARPPGGSTGGMAYLLGSHRPSSLMRFFRVGSLGEVEGADPEILALYGPGDPPHLDTISPRLAAWHDLARQEGALDRHAAQLPQIAAGLCEENQTLGRNQALLAAAGWLVESARPTESTTLTTPENQEREQEQEAPAPALAVETPPPAPSRPPLPDLPDTNTAGGGSGSGHQTAAARVLAALATGTTLTKQQLLETLAADGGRQLSNSRINTVLSEMTQSGRIISPNRGHYQLP
ncbi:hypothetical protein SAMN06297387_12854 [Streptomyces zhaozhouensis]|uniref:Uncharacterized protein n=1 Tax=Streptomyces zhaozhouensis TaxID=1300267 RepID=A0A286E831_9ACTN|nr:transfer protein [Streptomyces zhaozhouensis]SOD67077.1 hypothetical protein SAMN06297387_12854 [Streptomyces zhaozhouensis]